MISSSTTKLTWLIDCKHKVSDIVLAKVVRLVSAFNGKLTLVFDQRCRALENHFWFQNDDIAEVEKAWNETVEHSKNHVIKALKSKQVTFDFISVSSGNYKETLSSIDQHTLLILQHAPAGQQHPIFQELAHLPCQIALLKDQKWKKQPQIIAAIDPLHENARPIDLDEKIVSFTRYLSDKLTAQWTLIHACFIQGQFLKYKKYFEDMHREGVFKFLSDVQVSKSHLKMLYGLPEDVLMKWITSNEVDICVMGIVSRNT